VNRLYNSLASLSRRFLSGLFIVIVEEKPCFISFINLSISRFSSLFWALR